MKSIEQDLIEILDEKEEPLAFKSLSEATKMFDDLVKSGIINKRGNRLATENTISDGNIVFNR